MGCSVRACRTGWSWREGGVLEVDGSMGTSSSLSEWYREVM